MRISSPTPRFLIEMYLVLASTWWVYMQGRRDHGLGAAIFGAVLLLVAWALYFWLQYSGGSPKKRKTIARPRVSVREPTSWRSQ